MVIHSVKKNQAWCGEAVGILVLDENIPRVKGSVGNAETFSFPVRYRKIKGASVERLLKKKDPELLKPFIEAALELQEEGVASIAGSCGFMALFQDELAEALNIPVSMSSLLQLPLMLKMVGQKKQVGIITASESCLNERILAAAGIADACSRSRLSIVGLDNCEEAVGALMEQKGTLDEDLFRNEVLGAASTLCERGVDLGAILLECSELPPYSADVQKITGLPVFDFVSMIRFMYMGLRAGF